MHGLPLSLSRLGVTKRRVLVQCAKNPVPIGVGYLAQYIVKPLLGFMIAKVPVWPIAMPT